MQHHKYTLTELDNMIPFEREIYVELLSQWIKEENERLEKEGKNEMSKITKTVDPKIAEKDKNGDGHISELEYEMDMEFKRKELEDADAMRDAQRKMHGSHLWVCYCILCSCPCNGIRIRPSK